MIINANDVKIKGVSFFANLLEKFDEIIINVRGKNRYIVLDIDRYKELRANELDVAYINKMNDIKNGSYKEQTAKEHSEELEEEAMASVSSTYT